MSTRTDVDALVELPRAEREARLRAAAERVETRANRCVAEGRDLTPREDQLIRDDRAELEALMAANAIAEHSERMRSAVATAVETRGSRPEDHGQLIEFAQALTRGVPARVQIECRSITSANAGARGAVAVEQLGRPQWLWQAAGIPFTPADSLTVSGPLYDALVAQTATDEGGTKPAMGDPALASATLKAFAVTSVVSDQVIRFGVGAAAVSERLAAESVFSVNAAIADALETAAGTPVTYATSASHMADAGIAKVWAQTGAKPTALVINSADYPLLADKAAVGPGDTVGAPVVAFNGTTLLVNDAITAGIGVVVNGAAFSAHGTDVLLASLPDLDNNTVKLRAETYFALLQHDAGAIVAVDLVTP
ncbi:hypothetical protein QGN32_02185 [Mycolicibacterium sp. ND9-15]|uniref:hypothetical protein n=1 Tax=Mycolicibacterium sp. ND9-15 TaxID=3042320 RepID=UPI002DDB9BA7|nr:hypothetical protein [Mycolicibacterium sp. ND9-15]WSE56759.1 hypothetical protein QGN32_02185 [Mycolicibacterium sp. ND9-15]